METRINQQKIAKGQKQRKTEDEGRRKKRPRAGRDEQNHDSEPKAGGPCSRALEHYIQGAAICAEEGGRKRSRE
ncbi:hypothetical protein B7463_g10835, partial [Scytalidium lignicola]